MNISRYTNVIKGFHNTNNLYGWNFAKENVDREKKLIVFEGEKSTLKQATIERGNGYSVAVGGHEISEIQRNFIIKNTSEDTEIIIAFDKDVMKDEQYLIDTCKRFSRYRKASYVFDEYGVLGEKDSPIDKGMKRWNHLLKFRRAV